VQKNITSNLLSQFFFIRKYFWPYFRPDAGRVTINVLLIVIINSLYTLMIWLVGKNVNYLTAGQIDSLTRTLIALVAVVMSIQVLVFCNLYLFNWLGLRYVMRLRTNLLRHVMFGATALTQKFQKGDLLARMMNDVDRTLTYIIDVPLYLFSYCLIFLFYVAMLFWIDWKLAIISLLLSPLFYLLQRYLAPRKERASRQYFQRNGNLLGFEERAVNNLLGINTFNAQTEMSKRHNRILDDARMWLLKMRAIDLTHDAIFAFLTYFCAVLIVYFGIASIREQTLTVGALVSFIVYLGYLAFPLKAMASMPLQIKGDLGAAERIMEVLDCIPEVQDKPQATVLKGDDIRGNIVFEDVVFCYHDRQAAIFNHISVDFRAGETVALVGPSGSGKSTMARLIMRIYDPQHGKVCIDGHDLRDVTLTSLRDCIAIVWQEPFFLNDTIKNNLLLALPGASDEQVKQACIESQSWGFIEKLEQGWDTVIGAGGVELSAGQQQRLSIAQAFLRNAPILILDEASSALDSQSEQAIVSAIDKLRQQCTTLIIAHRYSSIRLADRVLYFNGDGSVMSGRHDELLRQHAGYREAVAWQTGAGQN
jgi:ATP-binding cassette subfamily B protein